MPNWAESTQAICAILTLVATVLGFLFISVQIRLIERQMRGDTHGTLYEHFSKISEQLSEDEELRPYFTEKQTCDETDPNHKKVQLMAEMFADYFEHVALQIENLPKESIDCWEKACFIRYQSSPAIQEQLKKYRHIYAPSIFRMLESGKKRLASPKSKATHEI